MESEIARLFIESSAKTMRQMLGYVEVCVGKLSDDQLWGRGAPHENSIGNLVLHLCGNMRQWIISGVGGQADVRDRPSEFSATGGPSGDELLARLRGTVEEAVGIINAVSAERLTEIITPQNHRASVLEAIYRVVGHFQQHTGQIIFATKIQGGEDLGLFRP